MGVGNWMLNAFWGVAAMKAERQEQIERERAWASRLPLGDPSGHSPAVSDALTKPRSARPASSRCVGCGARNISSVCEYSGSR